jgi:guanylate kinase
MSERKIIVLCGPSGSGKTTLARHVMQEMPELAFSISATTRPMRQGEKDGVDYHFISADEFRKRLSDEEFIESEEVYAGVFYGTLKSELERLWNEGRVPMLDIDVEGALNIKKQFGADVLSIFVHPMNIENIKKRLQHRATETEESYSKRVNRAMEELDYAPRLDKIVYNDDLDHAKQQAMRFITEYLSRDKQPQL